MPIANLVLLALLSGISAQDASSAAVKAGGHTYQLFCAQAGEDPAASETGICEKTEAGGVQRFEVRNETGDVQFTQDAPAGNPFTYVGIFAFANAGREILDVETSHEENAAGAKSAHLIYYFDPAPSGLIAFSPPLVGADGFAHVDTGAGAFANFRTPAFVNFRCCLVLIGADTVSKSCPVRLRSLPSLPQAERNRVLRQAPDR